VDNTWIFLIMNIICRASTPDFAQVTVGDCAWLDGLYKDQHKGHKGLLAALALQDGSIARIQWLPKYLERIL